MKIEVTQEHIKKGIPHDGCKCPVALAIREAAKVDINDIEVDYTDIRIAETFYELPDDVEEFIWDFDANQPVAPFTFDLPIEEVKESL